MEFLLYYPKWKIRMILCHKLKVTVKRTMRIQDYVFLPTVGVSLFVT